jgi:glycosyltransferase involved in cell wall biosynthesis
MNIESGGHLAQMRLLDTARRVAPAHAVVYESLDVSVPFLDDVLQQVDAARSIFVIHWGPHIPDLIHRLVDRNVVYLSYSTGYGFKVPARVPIIAGSRHTLAYWGKHAPDSLLYYLPAIISEEFTNLHQSRDIDVLVQKRKSSRYLLEELVPALQHDYSVTTLDSWVEDLAGIFNRTKVYLYDSSEYWAQHGLSEGFGLPPLEALACGCTVFSSINDALSDYLDPGFNCQKLHTYSLKYDLKQISSVIRSWQDQTLEDDPAEAYRAYAVERRLGRILSGLNDFFDHARHDLTPFQTRHISLGQASTPDLNEPSISKSILGIRRFLPKFIKNWIKSLGAG